MPRHRVVALTALLALAVVPLAGCTTDQGEGQDPGGSDAGVASSEVGVQLFQWTWNSIAQECGALAEAGYGWVLTSPPQEHILGTQWWTAYQPVSYRVESRLGTREQFATMVQTCGEAGIDIIADAVINHMTGQDNPGTGWAGSPYEHYSYPGLYTSDDFHHCGLTPNDDIADYTSAEQVQNCELVNLADLDTASEHVRDTIRGYLEDLLSLGVAGFRIDAAKHMPAEDIAAIVGPLPEGTRILQEVIGASGEPILPSDYVDNGQVFDFHFQRALTAAVRDTRPGAIVGIGQETTRLTSEQAITFAENHDTERNGQSLTFRDGEPYVLATVLLLAVDYGTPIVYSGYAFGLTTPAMGPAQDENGAVLDASCPEEIGLDVHLSDGTLVCQHRWPTTLGMLDWREAAGGAAVEDVVEDGALLALRRGNAVLLVNAGREDAALSYTTPLAPGTYCDLLTGASDESGCAGESVVAGEGGLVELTLPARTALAFVGSR